VLYIYLYTIEVSVQYASKIIEPRQMIPFVSVLIFLIHTVEKKYQIISIREIY